MKRRPGCLSSYGLVIVGVAVVAVVVVTLLSGGKVFSPGPMSAATGEAALGGVRSHAEIGGRCSACHPPPWRSETMTDLCLACHAGIGGEMQDAERLHGALRQASDSFACETCHTEHQGAGAELTLVNPEAFPHEATGYSLTGHQQLAAGRPFACIDCHGLDPGTFDVAFCADCHGDLDAGWMAAHVEAYGAECLTCHDGRDE